MESALRRSTPRRPLVGRLTPLGLPPSPKSVQGGATVPRILMGIKRSDLFQDARNASQSRSEGVRRRDAAEKAGTIRAGTAPPWDPLPRLGPYSFFLKPSERSMNRRSGHNVRAGCERQEVPAAKLPMQWSDWRAFAGAKKITILMVCSPRPPVVGRKRACSRTRAALGSPRGTGFRRSSRRTTPAPVARTDRP